MQKICALMVVALVIFETRAKSIPVDSEPEFPICNLIGRWKNQLGSVVALKKDNAPGKYSGPYYTAVVSSTGAAGLNNTGQATVSLHPKNHHSFVMNVLWAGGSLTSWVGQCFLNNNGSEVLDTSWLLLSPQPTLQDAWQSVRIGKDMFRREGD